MDPSAVCNIEREVPGNTAESRSSPSMTTSGVAQEAMDYEAWRVLLRSVCGRIMRRGCCVVGRC